MHATAGAHASMRAWHALVQAAGHHKLARAAFVADGAGGSIGQPPVSDDLVADAATPRYANTKRHALQFQGMPAPAPC